MDHTPTGESNTPEGSVASTMISLLLKSDKFKQLIGLCSDAGEAFEFTRRTLTMGKLLLGLGAFLAVDPAQADMKKALEQMNQHRVIESLIEAVEKSGSIQKHLNKPGQRPQELRPLDERQKSIVEQVTVMMQDKKEIENFARALTRARLNMEKLKKEGTVMDVNMFDADAFIREPDTGRLIPNPKKATIPQVSVDFQRAMEWVVMHPKNVFQQAGLRPLDVYALTPSGPSLRSETDLLPKQYRSNETFLKLCDDFGIPRGDATQGKPIEQIEKAAA